MIDVLAELSRILQETRTGKVADKLIEDLQASLEAERAREREQQRKRQQKSRERKRAERSANLPVTVTVRSELLPVTVTPPPPSPPVTVTSERNGSDLNFLLSETIHCKKEGFPDLKSRFSSPVTVTSVNDTIPCHGDTQNLSLSSIPCQNTLFPLADEKEERKKERTKERKKEETDCFLEEERKKERKNQSAREAMPRQGRGCVRRNKVPIPDDWQLTKAGLEFAERYGQLSPAAAAREASHFADHARAKGRICADWEAAWRNWVRSPYRIRQTVEQPFDVRRHIV